jgi:hypothetical protein
MAAAGKMTKAMAYAATGRKSSPHPKARRHGYGEALFCRIGVMRDR